MPALLMLKHSTAVRAEPLCFVTCEVPSLSSQHLVQSRGDECWTLPIYIGMKFIWQTDEHQGLSLAAQGAVQTEASAKGILHAAD